MSVRSAHENVKANKFTGEYVSACCNFIKMLNDSSMFPKKLITQILLNNLNNLIELRRIFMILINQLKMKYVKNAS